MVTYSDVKKYIDKSKTFFLSNDGKNVYLSNGRFFKTTSEFIEAVNKEIHCNFEVIYECHPTLEVVYRCKDCGTIIFASDDVERYETGLRCPVCSDYKTSYCYWTPEDVEQDSNKKDILDFYKNYMEFTDKSDKRFYRTGLTSCEIWKKIFKTKTHEYTVSLKCFNVFNSKLKGLRVCINKYSLRSGEHIKTIEIPMSISLIKAKYKSNK